MPKNSSTVPKRNVVATILGILGMSGIAGVLVAALMTPLIAVAGVAANSSITLFESLPDYLEIQPLQQKTELYGDLNGQRTKFATFYSQNRVEVSLDNISPYVVDAAIATEDPRFYDHGGVDVISATRALLVEVIGDDGGGASTITMQYVRNQRVQAAENLPDGEERDQAYREATEQTMGRKLQEMRLAIGVEQQFTKEQILQGYLNIALFGGQVYGIESAAQYYFGKPAKDLTLPEAATLVGTVQNPNAFRIDVPENLEASTERRNYVLRRMQEENKITKEEYEAAVATPIEPKITPSTQGCSNAEYETQYFCAYVREVIRNDPAFGATFEERDFNFRTKGYQIDTTIDLDLQQLVTEQVRTLPMPSEYIDVPLHFGSSAVALDPKTGGVLAMQQNTLFTESEEQADADPNYTGVNFNVDQQYGSSIGFQPGSTYKVFTLVNWLQSGHSLYEVINAKDRQFSNFQQSCDRVGGAAPYGPGNDGNAKYGNINAIQATQDSINTGFLAMAEQLDQCTTADIAEALGAHSANGEPLTTYPADIIGSGENNIAPMSLANAFGSIANDGLRCPPTPIKKVALADGTELAPPANQCTQAIDPQVARGAAMAMKTVMASGSGTSSNPGLTSEIIGKTGTTGGPSGAEQTWVVSSTRNFALAVWVGNAEKWCEKVSDNPEEWDCWGVSMRDLGIGQIRHEVARPILEAGINQYGAEPIPDPTGDIVQKKNVTVPNVVGMSVDAATSALTAAGFQVSVGDAVASDQKAGNIAKQNPSANTRAPEGTTVTINPSSGKADTTSNNGNGIAMPDLTGKTYDEAVRALTDAGFGEQGTQFTWDGPQNGRVTSTSPAPGEIVRPGSTVTIHAG